MSVAPPARRSRRTGVEVELLAPLGTDRGVLAGDLAAARGGSVRRSFHTDSEPSDVPGVGVFRHLSPGFAVIDAAGAPVAHLVDDVTVQEGLTPPAGAGGARATHASWYRVLSDDPRLLRLVERHADPAAAMDDVLAPVAELFGVGVETFRGAARVQDAAGATVAIAALAPAGRERVCEVVTPPLTGDLGPALEELLTPARALGFTVPVEAAVHLHVDGAPFRRPASFANLVRLFGLWRDPLWALLGTSERCQRLGPLPGALLDLVGARGGDGPEGWAALQRAARATGATKFADVNVTQLLTDTPVRDTVEVRILPGSIDGHDIAARAGLVHDLLDRCAQDEVVPAPEGLDPTADLAALRGLAGGRR